ncbi:MAG TPA: proton-conducting transporter membrane subunit, partial [Polyangia bacterium]|nr:proton-conducting transporter membrane subunit [Polyangia bacterium]
FDKDANALAGRKAFVVNRIGDFGFLLAMFLLYSKTGTLKYSELHTLMPGLAEHIWWGLPAAYFIGLLVLLGATGKSAQIPLYIWLPDAMAGPTPVSALIHAATMVTAGVYMVARMHAVFETAPVTLAVVACIGAATALFAATMGIAQRDLKKVLAYSTISQLGFMFVGVGSWSAETHSANYQAGIFHLVTHAFFKAGLFLAAGSVMHALNNEGDIMKMGGLKKWLPHTRWTFLIYCLAISGIIPFAGFWSKDAILGGLWDAQWITSGAPTNGLERLLFVAGEEGMYVFPLGHYLYWVVLLAAGCTAFYMFRLYFLVFEGEYRGPLPGADAHGHDDHGHDDHGHGNVQSNAAHAHGQGAHGHDAAHDDAHGHDAHGHGGLPHESPPAMTIVLWILAIGSVFVGLFGIPDVVSGHESNLFGDWLRPVLQPLGVEETAGGFWKGAVGALAVGIAGIGLAWLLYGQGVSAAVRKFVATLPGLYKLVFHKYYIDEIYDFLVVRPLRLIAFVLWKGFDAFFIDLIFVNGVGFVVGGFGKLVKYLQNGDLQRYIVGLILGAAALVYYGANGDVRKAAKFDVVVVGTSVEVNAKGAGPSSRRLQYRVDWDAAKSGGCNAEHYSATQQTTTFRHTYDAPGKYEVKVEAIDPRWNTSSTSTEKVKVQ